MTSLLVDVVRREPLAALPPDTLPWYPGWCWGSAAADARRPGGALLVVLYGAGRARRVAVRAGRR